METSSPARLFATLAGGFLVIAGIVGFFYNASFDTGKALRADDILGILSVNGWHNLFHIATGLLGLACAGYAARQYSLGIGLFYVIVAIWGFANAKHGHGNLLDLLPVNSADNFLHLIIGLAGLGAGAATLQASGANVPGTRRRNSAAQRSTSKASADGDAKPKSAVKTGTKRTSKTKAKPDTPPPRKRPPAESS